MINYTAVSITLLLAFGYINQLCAREDFVVVTPSYHNAHLVKQNLDSIFTQDMPAHVIYIADGDTLPDSDNTSEHVQEYIKEHALNNQITLIKNKDRKLALNNIYRAVLSCPDEAVIALVDGDDEFATPTALSSINALYESLNTFNNPVWFTYGNFKLKSSGQAWPWTVPVPDEVISNNAFREWGNGPTHVKTFKAWLFKQIKIEDLFFNGNFLTSTYDVAIFEPMMEMAAYNHHYTQEILYIYNDENPLNDGKVDRNLQIFFDHYIRGKEKYNQLSTSKSGWVDGLKQENKLKADIVLFSSSLEATKQFLTYHSAAIEGIHTITVILTNTLEIEQHAHLKTKFPFVIWENCSAEKTLKHIIEEVLLRASCDYILFTQDTAQVPLSLKSFIDPLYWLEQTHAYSWHGLVNEQSFKLLQAHDTTNTIQPVSLSLIEDKPDSLYAWQLKDSLAYNHWAINLALYRKKDLVELIKVANQQFTTFEDLATILSSKPLFNKVSLFYKGE